MRTSVFLIYLAVLTFLLSCQRSRLEPTGDLELEGEVEALAEPPAALFLDTPLPIDLCWDGEEPARLSSLKCWHERVPELKCKELRALESFVQHVLAYLDGGWKQAFFPTLKKEVHRNALGEDRIAQTIFLERQSFGLSATEIMGPDQSTFIESLSFHRRVREVWLPWVLMEGAHFGTMAEFLACGFQKEETAAAVLNESF